MRWRRSAQEAASVLQSLPGRRVVLEPLVPSHFRAWQEVRRRNEEWLVPWEPRKVPGIPDVVESLDAFTMRCRARERERQLGTGFGYGIFLSGQLVGEINLSSVQRGPFQSAYVGYWVDRAYAGQALVPEALVVIMQFAFEQLRLHRLQVSIIPRNQRSRRVVEKLKLREEGVALRYLEINGVWEDHVRYAMTVEEWTERREELAEQWL